MYVDVPLGRAGVPGKAEPDNNFREPDLNEAAAAADAAA